MTEAMADPADIYNWLRLDARTTTSGQPTQAQFDEIAALGVREVINLAPATSEKALKNEAEILAALGLRYTYIPVDFQNPTEEDFDRFRAAFESAGESATHVHCIANYRVSAFLYLYRISAGVEEARARADLDRIWTPNPIWAGFIERMRSRNSAR
ncbi:protein tyrosine phosphatase family protein [Methylocystis sp. H62]|uniref:protein tyrosine phosphatase family protein n=1 Tax=Methylocystis sp. H62 TaxID=2785789 RepID=UPI0018C31FAA|nr:protein tyrosine phosphatase family protein [Methylocystis sp. H62]MBG0794265.1 protein tyrosine phosphatase family protein [Methylocystis sp. H62]